MFIDYNNKRIYMLRREKDLENIGHCNFDVRLKKDETGENLIKRFLKKTKKEKLVEKIWERKHYKKPTAVRREAKHKREMVLKKLQQKQNEEMNVDFK